MHFDGTTWSTPSYTTANAYTTIWTAAPGGAWVGDSSGQVWRWDGSTLFASTGVGDGTYGFWGTSADDVWVVGEGGGTAHWDGAHGARPAP